MPTSQPQSNLTSIADAVPHRPDSNRRADISHFDDLPDAALISVKAVAEVMEKGVSTVWRNCLQDPDFPKPIRLGPGCTRFRVGAIRAFLAIKANAESKPKRAQRVKGTAA